LGYIVDTPDRRFVISPDVVHRELEGEAVLLNLNTGLYFGLNRTGTHMWRAIEQGATVREMVEAVSRAFSHPADQVEPDVRSLLAELEAKGLVTPSIP
jgi:hypothetical protein